MAPLSASLAPRAKCEREKMLEGTVKLFSSVLFAVAVGLVAAPAEAGIFYQSIPDLTVAPNIPEGYCSTCSASGNQWIGEVFTLSSTETVRSIEFTVATATFPTSVTLGFYDLGNSMTVGPQVGPNFTLSTCVPEPSTWAMMAAGFASLGLAGMFARSRRLTIERRASYSSSSLSQ